jgi:hypothetical protein
MPSNLEPAEFYRREADRLRSMADSHLFDDVREGLLTVAHHYDVLAGQSAAIRGHTFGQPLTRPRGGRTGESGAAVAHDAD